MNTRFALIALVVITTTSVTAFFPPIPRLVWNASPSVPVGLYVIRPAKRYQRGDLIAANRLNEIRRRGFETGRTSDRVFRCEKCGFMYTDDPGVDSSRCPQCGIAFRRGNRAPGGAIIKQSAAAAHLMEHEGRAVVFESLEDMANRKLYWCAGCQRAH